jgi:hypothetical protein
MQIELIDGRFSLNEMEKLLRAIFKAKIAFHEEKINAQLSNEEDIHHSETRITQLQETLAKTMQKLKASGKTTFDMHAGITVDMAPPLN